MMIAVTFLRQHRAKKCHTNYQKCDPCHCICTTPIDIVDNNSGWAAGTKFAFLFGLSPFGLL
jgi:hypothetical protein